MFVLFGQFEAPVNVVHGNGNVNPLITAGAILYSNQVLPSVPYFAMDRCNYQGSLILLVKWGFAPVGAKARKPAAGTHLYEVGSSFGRGWAFFAARTRSPLRSAKPATDPHTIRGPIADTAPSTAGCALWPWCRAGCAARTGGRPPSPYPRNRRIPDGGR